MPAFTKVWSVFSLVIRSRRFLVRSQTAVMSVAFDSLETDFTFVFTGLGRSQITDDARRIPDRQLDMGLEKDG